MLTQAKTPDPQEVLRRHDNVTLLLPLFSRDGGHYSGGDKKLLSGTDELKSYSCSDWSGVWKFYVQNYKWTLWIPKLKMARIVHPYVNDYCSSIFSTSEAAPNSYEQFSCQTWHYNTTKMCLFGAYAILGTWPSSQCCHFCGRVIQTDDQPVCFSKPKVMIILRIWHFSKATKFPLTSALENSTLVIMQISSNPYTPTHNPGPD